VSDTEQEGIQDTPFVFDRTQVNPEQEEERIGDARFSHVQEGMEQEYTSLPQEEYA
jgi:hypothetical protein